MSTNIKCYTSAARTATPTAMATQKNTKMARGLLVVIDTTAAGTSPSTTFTILGVDPLSGKTWTILASAAITAVGTVLLRIHPDLTASAGLIAKDVLPAAWKVTVTHGNGTSHTYSVSAHLLY